MLSPERRRNWAVVTALGTLVGAVIVAYPFALDAVLARVGVRSASLALLGLSLAPLLLSRRGFVRAGAAPAWGLPALLGIAAVTDAALWLRIVPALVYATLASMFADSLRAEDSLVERGARWLAPQVPDFVRPYCRRVTAVWAVFFALSAVAIAASAIGATPEAWRTWAGLGLYGSMLVLAAIEFFVRKTHFRHYFHMGPLDRLWSRVFPAENTAMGRRSAAHIRRFRESDGSNPELQ